MKTYILLSFFLAACGGTIDAPDAAPDVAPDAAPDVATDADAGLDPTIVCDVGGVNFTCGVQPDGSVEDWKFFPKQAPAGVCSRSNCPLGSLCILDDGKQGTCTQ